MFSLKDEKNVPCHKMLIDNMYYICMYSVSDSLWMQFLMHVAFSSPRQSLTAPDSE